MNDENAKAILSLLNKEFEYMYSPKGNFTFENRIKGSVDIHNKIINLLLKKKYTIIESNPENISTYQKLLSGILVAKNMSGVLKVEVKNNKIIVDNGFIPVNNKEVPYGIFDKRWKFYKDALLSFSNNNDKIKYQLFVNLLAKSINKTAYIYISILNDDSIRFDTAYSEKDVYADKDVAFVMPVFSIKGGWIADKKINWDNVEILKKVKNWKNTLFKNIGNDIELQNFILDSDIFEKGSLREYYLLPDDGSGGLRARLNDAFKKTFNIFFDELICQYFANERNFDKFKNSFISTLQQQLKNLQPIIHNDDSRSRVI